MALPATPATFESFSAELAALVDRFDRHHPIYTASDYNEATLRADFLDPFFRSLGWDVGNQKGLIHTEREVDIEVRTAQSGRQTRADYVFRFGRVDRFTCEAKKPAEVLHNRHIFQAKRDAFNRGIPLAVLSDFEEMKIYVVGSRPIVDEPHTGEWKIFNFRQYPAVARELWDLLAYEKVCGGSIDQLIDSLPKRPLKLKGRQGYLIKPDRTRSLDTDFLNFLDDVRQQLGSDLLKHNDRADLLSGHKLNEAAQRIIDRLVFLRICEDRGIDTGTLLETLFDGWFRQQPESRRPRLRKASHQSHLRFGGGGGAVEEEPQVEYGGSRRATEGGLYRELVEHVRALDQRPPSYKPFFNGQLFKAHFSEDLVVGDEWLANFILDLIADDTGYNFAEIKVEILGDAYERFLGNILVPKGRGAAIEQKPEVRKAGGVYYTPRYITDYIVEQTIGRLLEGKTPRQVEKLRFLDPACGSGSFLIRAYERVMEHYLRYFTAHPEKRRKDDCFVDAADNVRLTTALKRRILENNIYGVDIDAQAVEVTQLSLYLKMLEGENRNTLRQQAELFRSDPLLPPLGGNIKCFNSLIGNEFSGEVSEILRVNAGDWDTQFEEIFKDGGFDAVIGNPPYGASLDDASVAYLRKAFPNSGRETDTYAIFIEQSYRITRPGGVVSMIVPTGWYSGAKFPSLRRFFAISFDPISFVNLPYDIFADAWVDTTVFVAKRRAGQTKWPRLEKCDVSITTFPKKHKIGSRTEFDANARTADFAEWFDGGADIFLTYSDQRASRLIKRIESESVPFSVYADIQRGVTPFHTSPEPVHKNSRAAFNGTIRRYLTELGDAAFIRYDDSLAEFKPEKYFVGPRILIRELISRQFKLQASLVTEDFVTNKSMQSALSVKGGPPLQFLLGCLNSHLLSWLFLQKSNIAQRDDFPKIVLKETRTLPFPKIDSKNKHMMAVHDRIVVLVGKVLTFTPALRAAKTDAEKATLENAVKKTDREIDQLVYQLYGLTPEEIALVEGGGAPVAAAEAE